MNADSNNKSQPKRSPNRKSVKALGLLLIWLLLFSLYAPSIGAVPMAQASSAPMPAPASNALTAPSASASAYGSGSASASATEDGSNANAANPSTASANYLSQLQQAKAKLLATGEGEDDAPPTAPLPLAAAALPMVVNPTFESGTLDGWLTSGQAPTLVTTAPYNGRYTARLDKATSYLYQVVTGLAPNTSYYFKATARVATAGDYAILGVKNYGGPELSRNIGYTQYESVGVLFTTGATNTSAEIYIWKPATTDYIYADDFELTESAVANGGFELRSVLSPDRNPVGTPVLAPWQASGADAVSIITNEDRRSGVSALRLGPAAGANAVQNVAVKPNTSYALSIWGKAGSDGQAVEASVKVGDQPEQRQSVTTAAYFDQAFFIFTTGTNDTSASLKVSKVAAGGGSGGGGYVYADDITVTELVLPPNNALVINGSFENDTLTPWQNWGGGEVVGNNARSGTSALKLGPQIRVGAIQTVRNLSPNTSYTFKGWIKADAGANATLGVKNYGGEELRQVINTPTYTQASVTFTTGATNTTAEVYVWKTPTAGQGYVYADDLELSLSTPATAPLDAFRLIEAESYAGTPGGVVREAASKDVYGSDGVGGLANDTVLTYNNVNFGTGANSIELRILPGSKEATIEVYTDLAATTPLGTARVVPTSSSSSESPTQPGQTPPPSAAAPAPAPALAPVWNISRALITPTTGVKTVYLKIKGEGANELKLNWFRFFPPTPLDTAELAYVSEMLMLKQGRGITVTFLDAKFVPHLSRILLAFRFDSTSPEGNADLAKIRVGTKINSDINPELNGPQVKVARITARSASSVTVEGDLIKFDDFVQAGSIDIDSAAANAALAQAVNAYGANLDWPDPEPPAPVEQWNEADTALYLDANKDLQAQAGPANPNGQSTTGTGLGASSVNPNSSSNANANAAAKPNSSPGTTPPKAKPSGPNRIIKLALKLPTFVMDSTGLSLGLSAKGTYYGATANRLSGANERLSDGVALSGEVGVDVASKTSFGWQKMRLFPPTSPLSAITSTVEAKLAFRTNVGLLLTPEEVNITPKDKDIEFSIPTSVGPIPFGLAITLERELLVGSSAFIDCTFSVKYTHATSFSRTPLDPTKLGFQNTSPGCRSPHAPSAVGEFETVIVFKVKAVKSPNLPQPMRVAISAIPEVPPFGKAIKAAKNLVLKGGSLASISPGVGANLKLSYIPWYNKVVPVLSFSVGVIGKISLKAPEVPPDNPLHAYMLIASVENKVPDLYKAEWGLYDLSLKVTNKNPKTGRAEVNWAFTRIADYRETLWLLPPRIVNYSTLPKCELWREAWGRTASIGNQQWKISTQCSGSGSFLYDPAKYRGARYFLRFHRVGMFGQVSTNSVEVPVKNGNSEASLGAPTVAAAAAGVGGQKPSASGSGEGKATAQSATIPVPDPEAEDLDSHYSESEFMTEYKPSEAVDGGYKIFGGFSSYGEENPPTQPLLRSIKCSVTEAPKSGAFTLDPPGPQSNPALHELQFGSGVYKPNSPNFTGTDEFVVTCKWRNAGGAIVTNVHRQSLFIEDEAKRTWLGTWCGTYTSTTETTSPSPSYPKEGPVRMYLTKREGDKVTGWLQAFDVHSSVNVGVPITGTVDAATNTLLLTNVSTFAGRKLDFSANMDMSGNLSNLVFNTTSTITGLTLNQNCKPYVDISVRPVSTDLTTNTRTACGQTQVFTGMSIPDGGAITYWHLHHMWRTQLDLSTGKYAWKAGASQLFTSPPFSYAYPPTNGTTQNINFDPISLSGNSSYASKLGGNSSTTDEWSGVGDASVKVGSSKVVEGQYRQIIHRTGGTCNGSSEVAVTKSDITSALLTTKRDLNDRWFYLTPVSGSSGYWYGSGSPLTFVDSSLLYDYTVTSPAGTNITATLPIQNLGWENWTGAKVKGTVSAGYSNYAWTCSYDDGSSCGSGNAGIDATISLKTGEKATFTITATVTAPKDTIITSTLNIERPNPVMGGVDYSDYAPIQYTELRRVT